MIKNSAPDAVNDDRSGIPPTPDAKFVLLSYPQDANGIRGLGRFIRIFSTLGVRLLMMGDSKVSSGVEIIHVDFPRRPGIIRFSFFQARMTFTLWRTRNSWDSMWLLHGSTAMILPIIAARVAGKKAVLVWTASSAKIAIRQHGGLSIHALLLNIVESLVLAYSSHIVTYGQSISVHVRGLRGRPDALALGAEFVDLDRFVMQGPVGQRQLSVGFVGRLSPEKGLSNFLRALALLAPEFPRLEAYVIGMGELLPKVLDFASGFRLMNRLQIPGNVDQDTLPGLYGRIRVLVIPSYTEGLPNVMLEAMACGTLVLATRVGAIPDVIEHNVNGFLLKDNSPESIAGGVRAIFGMPAEELEQIARRAESTVRQNFGLLASVDRYRRIVHQII